MLEEEIHDVVVTSLSGPHCRSSGRISSFCIDFGPSLNEVLAQCVVIIYGGPLEVRLC